MDNQLFLQTLRDLTLEEGKAYIREHIEELGDHKAVGELIADEALKYLYDPFLSLKLSELLIFFGDHVNHLLSHALGLKAKGDALEQMGQHQAAMECSDISAEEFHQLGDECNEARTRISWMVACALLGHVDEALRGASQARDVFLRLEEPYWVCIVDHNTAFIYEFVGRYQDALNLYERMLTIYPTIHGQSETFLKRAIALAEMNQARILSWLGKFEQAYQLLQQAQASFMLLEQTSQAITAEFNLADLDYAQGYYGSALRRYYQVRDAWIQSKLDTPTRIARIMQRTATCLVKLDRANEACELASKAVEILRQLDTARNPATAYTLREYSVALMAGGRLTDASIALNEAENIFTSGCLSHYASLVKLQRAELLVEMKAFTEAYDEAHVARQYFMTHGLVVASVRAGLVMAAALIENARKALKPQEWEQRAILLCEEAAFQAHQHDLQEQVYKSNYLLGRLASIQGSLESAADYYEKSIAQIEYILDDLTYELSPSFLRTTWMIYEEMIALCLQRGQTERAFEYLERVRSVALRQHLNKAKIIKAGRKEQAATPIIDTIQARGATLLRIQYELEQSQQEYRKLNTQLSQLEVSATSTFDQTVIQEELKRYEGKISELAEQLELYKSGGTLHALDTSSIKTNRKYEIDVPQLRQHLTANQLMLAYFLYEEKLVIFALTKDDVYVREITEGAVQLERLLPILHAHLQPAGWADPQRPPQQAILRLLNRLYDILVSPVVDLLPPSPGPLTIVPYGPLHSLPFHALYNGSRFLVEDFQITYLPASNILTQFDIEEHQEAYSSARTMEIAKPPLIFGYSGGGQLQRAVEEAKVLTTMLRGHCYLDSDATIMRLQNEAAGSPIIHLATHGKSRLDAPNFSSVLLADGPLTAIDAFGLGLKGCELVTLSGCETGLALSGGGDEQLGLGRAFLAAGASSLVISLWPVEDQATSELMQLFYQHLLNNESKVQALRATQCDLLRKSESRYAHPYFWASFRLVGDASPLHTYTIAHVTSSEEQTPKKVLT